MVRHFLLSFSTIVVFSFPTEVFACFDFFLNKQLNKPFTDTFNKTTGLQALTIASYCRFFKIGNNHSEFGILFYNLFLIIWTTVSSSTLSQVLVNSSQIKDYIQIYFNIYILYILSCSCSCLQLAPNWTKMKSKTQNEDPRISPKHLFFPLLYLLSFIFFATTTLSCPPHFLPRSPILLYEVA